MAEKLQKAILRPLKNILRKYFFSAIIMSEKTIYDCERAKFEGFGTYKLPIEERVNEIMEATKKEYPTVDNYLLWLCAVDYVLEEKGLKKDNEDGVKMY